MSMSKIHARQIFDSRGNPTVEVDLYTDQGKLLLIDIVVIIVIIVVFIILY